MFKKYLKENTRLNSGFTLIEMLIAIAIFSLSIIALMSILGSGMSDTIYAQAKIKASYLAQEGIESIRNMRDSYALYDTVSGWNNFKSALNSCNVSNECGFDNAILSTDPGFIFVCSSGSCELYLDNGGYSINPSGTPSGFTRKIWMDIFSVDEVKIYSEVSWVQGSGSHNIIFSENLLNWAE